MSEIQEIVLTEEQQKQATKIFEDKENYESNMEVIVEFRGERYRVDFSQYSEEYQMMPRSIKKQMVLDDLKQNFKKQKEKSKLTKNQTVQDNKRQSVVERLREKLRRKNPFRTDVQKRNNSLEPITED